MREMSVLEDYEIVDAALRDRLAVLKADIDSMVSGGGDEPSVEPVWIVNPEGISWDDVYLQADGTPQEGSFRISGDYADVVCLSTPYYTEDIVKQWVYRLVSGNPNNRTSRVFLSPIKCSEYNKLRIKYCVRHYGDGLSGFANILIIKDIDPVASTIGETYRIMDFGPEYAAAINGSGCPPYYQNEWSSIGQNANSDEWKLVDIDVGDIDEFYLGFQVSWNYALAIMYIQLVKE